MDQIKEAFSKIKQDMESLQYQIYSLSQEIQEINRTLSYLISQTQELQNQTDRQIIQTDNLYPEDFPIGNKGVSTGNEGVQTDRQTIRQTDRHIPEVRLNHVNSPLIEPTNQPLRDPTNPLPEDPISNIEKVSKVLDSLDSLKKELRTKFKKLTSQEMLIFSTAYQLEDLGHSVDYSTLSSKLNLSESSIRDYIKNIIKKGIPVDKIKQNNKKVTLSISKNLKKMASLDTIIKLREI